MPIGLPTDIAIVGKALNRMRPGEPAVLIVDHQPQAIAERAYQETLGAGQNINLKRDGTSPGPNDPPLPQPTSEGSPVAPNVADARIAGPSRVVFAMPSAQNSFTWGDAPVLEGLLEACRSWPMVLEERLGPASFRLAMRATPSGFGWELQGWRVGPLPLARWLGPQVRARCFEADGDYRFSVVVAHPWLGVVMAYAGRLELDGSAAQVPLPLAGRG